MALLSVDEIGQLLKEFFLGPVHEQLNRETVALDLFEKSRVNWAGRIAIVPVHLGATGGSVDFSDGGVLPNAREQDYLKLSVEARRLYARFQIDGIVMEAAKKGQSDQVINWMEGSMDALVKDVKDEMNKVVFSGGRCVGFGTMTNTAAPIAAGGNAVYAFFGDISKLAVADTVSLFDMAAGVVVDTGAIAAVDATNLTITVTLVGGLSVAQQDLVVSVTNTSAAGLDEEPVGIFGGIGAQSYFGADRSTAVPANAQLRSNVLAQTAGTARAPLSLVRLQACIDTVLNASGEDIDVIFMNPLQRQSYTALLTATVSLQTMTDKARKGDGGFTGLSYGGVEIRTSRHCPRGGIVMLSISHWKLLQLGEPGFADFDGSALSRRGTGVGALDAAEGYWRSYYNHVCTRPNAQAVLAGINIS